MQVFEITIVNARTTLNYVTFTTENIFTIKYIFTYITTLPQFKQLSLIRNCENTAYCENAVSRDTLFNLESIGNCEDNLALAGRWRLSFSEHQ